MARNRNSHETRKKILEVSKNLFLEKGFDNTSIQDIIDGLGGLTKGVIYHHFESKYDILQTIISENNQEILNYNWRGNTGLEKIQNSLMDSFSNFEHQRLVYSASIMLRSPRLLGEQYLGLFSFSISSTSCKMRTTLLLPRCSVQNAVQLLDVRTGRPVVANVKFGSVTTVIR